MSFIKGFLGCYNASIEAAYFFDNFVIYCIIRVESVFDLKGDKYG